VLLRTKDGVENLFDLEKSHFSRWIRVLDSGYLWLVPEIRPELLEGTPIYYAAFCGFNNVMEKLIREHPEHLNLRGSLLGTALHAASRRDHIKVVQSLLRHGADVNAPGQWVCIIKKPFTCKNLSNPL
jgi:ankyrin repeat protein